MMIARIGLLASVVVFSAVSHADAAPAASALRASGSQALENLSQTFRSAPIASGLAGANTLREGPPVQGLTGASAKVARPEADALVSPASRAWTNAVSGKDASSLRFSNDSQSALAAPQSLADANGFAAIAHAPKSDLTSSPALKGLGFKSTASESLRGLSPQ